MATCVNLLRTVILVLIAFASVESRHTQEGLARLARAFSNPTVSQPWNPGFPLFQNSSHTLSSQFSLRRLNTHCIEDFLQYAEKVNSEFTYENSWAFKMLDSSTKIPDGLIFGNMVHMGNFDECLSIREVESYSGGKVFDGRHCMVNFTAQNHIRPDGVIVTPIYRAANTIDEWKDIVRAVETGDVLLASRADLTMPLSLQLAWCVPSSCRHEDVELIAKVTAVALTAASKMPVSASVDPAQCHTADQSSLRAIDIFAICFLGLFIVLAVASTAYDVITRESKNQLYLLRAFSIYSNWPKLIQVNTRGDQLHCLHGIRAITIGWVVLGHVYLLNTQLPAINTFDYLPNFIKSLSRLVIMNGTLALDTFFFMSGLLLSFLFIKEVRRTNRFNYVKFYVRRYLRLTPVYAVLILLTVTIMNYAGNGPLWHSRHNDIKERCDENWWTNIIYVNNYVHPKRMCLEHTWYLAVDMQLHWLSPLILIPMWKVGKRNSTLLISLLMLAGWAIPFTIVYLMELYPGTYVGTVEDREKTMQYYYWPTHTRFVAWLIGVYLGYLLQDARRNKPELPPWFITFGWIVSTVFMTGALNAAYPFQQPNYVYNKVEAAFWLSLFRPMWTIGLAWIIFACDQGYGGFVDIILSWGFWQPLARLSYAVYLLHVSVLHLFAGVVQTPTYLADVITIPQFFAVLLMSIAWAIPMTLLFEMPIILIDNAIFGIKAPTNSQQTQLHLDRGIRKPLDKRWDDAVMENNNLTLPRVTMSGPPDFMNTASNS